MNVLTISLKYSLTAQPKKQQVRNKFWAGTRQECGGNKTKTKVNRGQGKWDSQDGWRNNSNKIRTVQILFSALLSFAPITSYCFIWSDQDPKKVEIYFHFNSSFHLMLSLRAFHHNLHQQNVLRSTASFQITFWW
jgi:hypothetical protein